MPTVHPFEAQMDADGTVTLTSAPADPALRERIVAALRQTQPTGDAWARSYRRQYVRAGLPQKLIETREDLEAIPVPPLRRLSGELVFNLDPRTLRNDPVRAVREYTPLEGGGHLHLRSEEFSTGGGKWESLPEDPNPLAGFRYLTQHPLAREKGTVVASYLAEHWHEGRIDFEPEPPEEQLDELEALVRDWHGETPEDWAERHYDSLDVPEEEEAEAPVPLARRLVLELREPTPLGSPLNIAVTTLGEHDVHIDPEGGFYTLDGETWLSYADPDAEPQEDGAGELGDLLSNMLDVKTVPVTVWQGGRVEWEEGAVPAEQAERVRAELVEATGAGNPDAWADWTRAVLVETFAEEAPHLADLDALPTVQAVRLDLPTDALSDPDDPAQYFMESEVTFDGVNWRDLYGETVPEELERLRPSN
ncbi:hypothetical protein V3W47_06225 [Deinococcus sp. YIM 134068]|uniref:hypothetical protein n=1 Tax=Deinococcus lichenicola TaxID=3118910 RepID=UPI002F952121